MTAPIYGPAGAITLIGRAWNLFKVHWRASLLLMIAPMVLNTLQGLLSSLHGAVPTLTRVGFTQILMNLGLFVGSLGTAFLASAATVFCCVALCRIFYVSLTEKRRMTLRESLDFLRNIWLRLLGLMILVFVFSIVVAALNIGIAFAGIIAAGAAMAFFGAARGNAVVMVGSVLFMLLVGFAVVSAIALLLGLQAMLGMMPFVAIAASDGSKMTASVFHAWRLTFRNLPRAMLFGALLALFSLTLSMVLNTPAFIWAMFEMQRLITANPAMNPGTPPPHVQFILTLWGSLMYMGVVPFLCAAGVLFWYDCQVRREGLDLSLWLRRLSGDASPTSLQSSP